MIATFILFLREGLEASLIVSLIFAALRQLGQTRQVRAVWIGIALAILSALGGGIALYFTVRAYPDTTFQTIFETGTYLVAVVLLTTMTFWMQQHSRSMKKEFIAKASSASSGFAFALFAFTSVGREALESAFFTLAFAFQTNGFLLLAGGLLGVLTSVGLCILIYRLGYRLDYRIFFRVMGILLLFFAAGLLGNAIQNFQELGWINFGTTVVWNTSGILSQDSVMGDLLHGLVGYSDAPSVLQSVSYIVYLLIFGGIFYWMTRKPGSGRSVSSSDSTSALTGKA